MLPLRFVLILLILALTARCPARQPAGTPQGLGTIHFPNSCSSAAQPALLKGIAELHSFQYAAAEKAFAEVPQADPQCAMAFWGLAMSHYQQLWDGASESALVRGRDSL